MRDTVSSDRRSGRVQERPLTEILLSASGADLITRPRSTADEGTTTAGDRKVPSATTMAFGNRTVRGTTWRTCFIPKTADGQSPPAATPRNSSAKSSPAKMTSTSLTTTASRCVNSEGTARPMTLTASTRTRRWPSATPHIPTRNRCLLSGVKRVGSREVQTGRTKSPLRPDNTQRWGRAGSRRSMQPLPMAPISRARLTMLGSRCLAACRRLNIPASPS
mmetsp:Transcript_39067/g.127048  ORF Transcript_39067/g.127048 Transcript_39067/m.127048 type:complete len:220 (+) Transcript_39067:548-1207(+)